MPERILQPVVRCLYLITAVLIATSPSAGAPPESLGMADPTGGIGPRNPPVNQRFQGPVDVQVGPRLLASYGAYAKTWNGQFFIQPSVLTCDGSGVDRAQQSRLPGDFETHEAVVLVADGLARDFPEILTTIVARLKDRQTVIALVSSVVHRNYVTRVLTDRRLSLESVQFVIAPTNTIWMRDFGPLFVCRPDGTGCAVDPGYGKPLRAADDGIPAAIRERYML